MDLTQRDECVLTFLAENYTATAEQIRANVSPDNADTTTLRRRLRLMHGDGLVNIARCEVISPNNDVYCQVYYPSQKGMLELARRSGDMKWTLTPTKPPYTQHMAHFIALTDLRILIKRAVSDQAAFTLGTYYNQFDTTNPDAADPAKRFKLYTEVQTQPKKIACVPDAAFDLRVENLTKAFYVELERGTTPTGKAAAKKSPGYSGLLTRKLHKCHFPGAIDRFAVLVFAPHPGWRDSLRREFAKRANPELYKFASMTDVTKESLLLAPIWYPCVGTAEPLLKVQQKVVAAVSHGVSEGVPTGAQSGTGESP